MQPISNSNAINPIFEFDCLVETFMHIQWSSDNSNLSNSRTWLIRAGRLLKINMRFYFELRVTLSLFCFDLLKIDHLNILLLDGAIFSLFVLIKYLFIYFFYILPHVCFL